MNIFVNYSYKYVEIKIPSFPQKKKTPTNWWISNYSDGQNFVSGVDGNGNLRIKAADFTYWVCIACTMYMLTLTPRICGQYFLSFPQKKTLSPEKLTKYQAEQFYKTSILE